MGINWSKQGLRYGVLVKISANYYDSGVLTRNLYACSEDMVGGWQDPSTGDKYEPRLKNVKIDYDLGGFRLDHSSGLLREVCTLGLSIGGYSDAAFWSTFMGGDTISTRLNSAVITVRCVDLDSQSDIDYMHIGVISGRPTTFSPNSSVSIKSLGGHALLHEQIRLDYWEAGQFETGTTTSGMAPESVAALGRVIPWAWGSAVTIEGTCFAEGTGTGADLSATDDRALCFAANPSPVSIGTTVVCTYIDGSGVASRADLTKDAGDNNLTYTSGGKSIPFYAFNLDANTGLADPNNESQDTVYASINFCSGSGENTTTILNQVLFANAGIAYLYNEDAVEAKDSSVWAEWTTWVDAGGYLVNVVVPSSSKKEQLRKNVPLLREFVAELLWVTGSDAWWTYTSAGVRTWYFEKRDTSARHPSGSFAAAVTLRAPDFDEDSLALRLDPHGDYANEQTVSLASGYSPLGGLFIPGFSGGSNTKAVSSETSGGLNPSKRASVSLRSVEQIAGGADTFNWRVEDLAQDHYYYEWTSPIQRMGLGIHDLVNFDIDSWPTKQAQIRRKTVDLSKGKISFMACTASGVYS